LHGRGSRMRHRGLAQLGQLQAKFTRGAEKGVFGRAFGGVEDFGNSSQLHALIVLQLKNHAFAR